VSADDPTCRAGRVSSVFDHARAVADAVLYEGYLLYPYRRSSGKNHVRWQFGVLAPRDWIELRGAVVDSVAGSTESWWQQTACLLEAPESAAVHVRPRYLQVQSRSVEQRRPDGTFAPVERLEWGDRAEIGFEEAVAREADVVTSIGALLAGERSVHFGAPGGEDVEPAYDDRGREVGRVVRRRWPVSATMRLRVERAEAPFALYRLVVRIENDDNDTSPRASRPEALRRSLIATHTLLALDDGVFVTLLDPPVWAAPAAKACANIRTFPVLAGPPTRGDLLLSSPILLYDHPQIAPESPADLHDATEIDEILSLRTLTLTDEEKREARATDPRAAAIVDRIDTMPPEMMERLHGAIRSVRPGSGPGTSPGTSPGTNTVMVDGVRIAKGSRVRLHPRRRGDAHDMFLAGRDAVVEAVFVGVDDTRHVAVTIEDDPSAEMHQWYGRYRYFAPDEVEPLDDGGEAVR
jgi:hypothetical protein